MKKPATLAIASSLFLFSALAASAQTLIPIVNASFEDPVLTSGQYVGGAIGWLGGPSEAYVGTQNVSGQGMYSSLPAGNNIAIIAQDGYLSQVLSSNLSEGSYTLTAYVGQNIGIANPDQFKLQLLAGSTLLAETTAITPSGEFSQFSVSYTATGLDPLLGQALQIRVLSNTNLTPDVTQTSVDGFALSYTAVPEPASMALVMMAAGVCVVVMVRKARKAKLA